MISAQRWGEHFTVPDEGWVVESGPHAGKRMAELTDEQIREGNTDGHGPAPDESKIKSKSMGVN